MMFGITTPDAIALGMLLIAAVAMLNGSNSGAAAKEKAIRSAAMVSIEGSIVDGHQFGDYIKVLDKLAIGLHYHDAIKAQQKVRIAKHTNAIERLGEKVDEAFERSFRAPASAEIKRLGGLEGRRRASRSSSRGQKVAPAGSPSADARSCCSNCKTARPTL